MQVDMVCMDKGVGIRKKQGVEVEQYGEYTSNDIEFLIKYSE